MRAAHVLVEAAVGVPRGGAARLPGALRHLVAVAAARVEAAAGAGPGGKVDRRGSRPGRAGERRGGGGDRGEREPEQCGGVDGSGSHCHALFLCFHGFWIGGEKCSLRKL